MRAALVLALVLGTASAARADGIYFSQQMGGTSVGNELSGQITDAMRLRFAAGYRLNTSWAVEAFIAGDIGTTSHLVEPTYAARCSSCDGGYGGGYGGGYHRGSSLTTAGVDLKYLRPVNERFEVYLRGSLGKGWLDSTDYAGRGFGVGAGAQLKGKVRALGFLFWPLFFVPHGPKVTAALFVDAGTNFYRLHRHGELDNPDSIDASTNQFTVGWAVGADF